VALSDDIADRFVERDLLVMRLESEHQRRALAAARELERDYLLALRRIDPTDVDRASAQRARVERLEAEVWKLSRAAFRKVDNENRAEYVVLAGLLARDTVDSVNDLSGTRLLTAALGAEGARRLIEGLTVQGHPIRSWWNGVARKVTDDVVAEVRKGLDEVPANLTKITRRVRGTEDRNYRNGVREGIGRDISTIIRTTTQTVSNDARMAVYEQNQDVIRGVQASNPLDSRTSDICRARAGMAWDIRTGEPFPGTSGSFPGPPPWHFGCRTVLIPILRPATELRRIRGGRGRTIRRRLERLERDRRATLDGRPAGDMTFGDWLRKRSEAQQREILGPGKYDLWKAGQIDMRQLIDQQGNPMTLAELRARFG